MFNEEDKKRLDFLDSMLGEYTGKVVLRMSSRGRGMRLHETSKEGASDTVREAIDKEMLREEARLAKEMLEESTESGESSLDIAIKVYGLIKDAHPELAERFNTEYSAFANEEVEEMQEGTLKEVYNALDSVIEYGKK